MTARPAPRRPSRRRRLLVAVLAPVTGVALAGVAFAALLLVTPSASGAVARVAAILAAHEAPSDGGVVPYRVGAAVLATEDSRYYSDPAVDPKGAVRATWGFITRNPNEGGATIEVQLAKLLYTPGDSSAGALAEQLALAFKLDADYTKQHILAMYLDAAYYGDGAYGVTAAAQHYFGRPPSQLTWGQAALLAGLVQAPSRLDPHGHLTAALRRRSHVLARLVAVGDLTKAQAGAAATAGLDPAVPFYG